MVILLLYANSFVVLPLKDQAKEAPDLDGVLTFAVPGQGVEIPTWLSHIAGLRCRVQSGKQILQVCGGSRVDAFGAAIFPEPTQRAVRYAHRRASPRM
jgi:hypothetical protein